MKNISGMTAGLLAAGALAACAFAIFHTTHSGSKSGDVRGIVRQLAQAQPAGDNAALPPGAATRGTLMWKSNKAVAH